MDYDGTTNGLKSIKTIYDPCPAGFKVPEGTPYTAFTTTGKSSSDMEQFNVEGNYNSGWNFNNKLENPNALKPYFEYFEEQLPYDKIRLALAIIEKENQE